MNLFVSDYLEQPTNIDQRIPFTRLTSNSSQVLQRGLAEAGVLPSIPEYEFSFRMLTKLPYESLLNAKNNGPVKTKKLIYELMTLFEVNYPQSAKSLASLLKKPKYPKYLVPWTSLSGRSRNILQRGLVIAKISDIDFKTGFSYNQLDKVDIEVFKHVKNVGSYSLDSLFLELRRVFENLPGPSNLSNIEVDIDLNQVSSNASSSKAMQYEFQQFDHCGNLADLFSRLENFIEGLPEFQHFPFHESDERSIQVLKGRHPAFCERLKTLDEIGKIWGVTRERIRQIELKQKDLRIEELSKVPIMKEIDKLLTQSESEEVFMNLLKIEGYISDETTPNLINRLKSIAELLAMDDLVITIESCKNNWDGKRKHVNQYAEVIKDYRSKFGLIQLDIIRKDTQLNNDQIKKLILSQYPRTIFVDNLALARTNHLDTMFEGTLGKQLKVSGTLTPEELLIGLKRYSKYRKSPLLGSNEDLIELITILCSRPSTYDTLLPQLQKALDFEEIDQFLIETLSGAQMGILHRSEILEEALLQGLNISSVGVFLLYSPIVRSPAKALFSLVGTFVDQQSVEFYSKMLKNKQISAIVNVYIIDAFEVKVSIVPNLNTITNGSVFLAQNDKQLFSDQRFKASCTCGKLETDQVVKFTESGFWNGFTSMFFHGIYDHNLSYKETFTFHFDFRNRIVMLEL